MKKQRGDSHLKTLPEERQRDIIDHLKGHTYTETKLWLAQDGVQTSSGALSGFFSWWQLRSAMKQAESDTLNLLDLIQDEMPEMPADKVTQLGEALFNLQAIRTQDPKTFLAFQSAKHKGKMDQLNYDQRERELQLSVQKFQRETAELFLKWNADQRASQIASSSQSNTQKIEQLGALMFGEEWR
jgi:hypothetical protein